MPEAAASAEPSPKASAMMRSRGLDVLGDGPHGQTRFGAVDDPQEPEHEHEADHGHDKRDRQQLQLPEVDGRHEPFRLVHGARKAGKHHHGKAFDEEGHGDGTDERRNARGVAQGPVGDAVHQDADGAGREDGHHHGHPPGQEECRGAVKDEIGPQHENVAVGEVDQAQDAVNHGVSDGDQGVLPAQRDAGEQDGNSVLHRDTPFSFRVGEREGPSPKRPGCGPFRGGPISRKNKPPGGGYPARLAGWQAYSTVWTVSSVQALLAVSAVLI